MILKIIVSLFVYFVMMVAMVFAEGSRETRSTMVFYTKRFLEVKVEIRTDFGGKTSQQNYERWKPTTKVKKGFAIADREPCTFEEAMERAFECQKLLNEGRK